MVVSNAPGSPRPSERMTCSIHALSLPLLQESRIFIESPEHVRVQCLRHELDAFADARTWHDRHLLIDQVNTIAADRRNGAERLPHGDFLHPDRGRNRIAS